MQLLLDFAKRAGRHHVRRQRLRQRNQPFHRLSPPLRKRLRWKRRPQRPHLGRHVAVGQQLLAVDDRLLFTTRHGVQLAGKEPDVVSDASGLG